MLEAEMSRRKAKLTVDRAAGLMSEQEYNDQLEALELDRLRRIALLREREGDYSGAVKAQAAYEKSVRDDQLKHQEEFIAQADELMNKYLDNTEAETNREMALLNRMLEAHIITAEQMEAIKVNILKTLRIYLRNNAIQLSFKLTNKKDEVKILSRKEQFEQMAEKNKLVDTLRELFGLELA